MKRHNNHIRVMLASEFPEMRTFLKNMVQAEEGAVIVGEAENATKALTLARNLRPDVAIIDSCLPLNIGLDVNPLSRISGLDAAETISEEIPNARVVLLNRPINTNEMETNCKVVVSPFFCQGNTETCTPFTIGELNDNLAPTLVFAHVEAETKTAPRQGLSLSEKALVFGGLAILAGWVLINVLLAVPPGVLLAMAGGAAITFGLIGKMISKIIGRPD